MRRHNTWAGDALLLIFDVSAIDDLVSPPSDLFFVSVVSFCKWGYLLQKIPSTCNIQCVFCVTNSLATLRIYRIIANSWSSGHRFHRGFLAGRKLLGCHFRRLFEQHRCRSWFTAFPSSLHLIHLNFIIMVRILYDVTWTSTSEEYSFLPLNGFVSATSTYE